MTYPYQMVVFDWEGTIVDPLGALVNYLWSEANQQGWAAFSQSQVRNHLLQGVPKAVQALFPGLSELHAHALVERAERTVTQERHKVYVFPGIKILLQQLRHVGIICAVASNKGLISFQNALASSDLQEYIQIYRCAGALPPKPNPQMLIEILDAYQIMPNMAVMIGDSFADIEMARVLNVDAIAVDWYASGMWHPDKMGAKGVVHTVEHLSNLLGIQLSSGEKLESGV